MPFCALVIAKIFKTYVVGKYIVIFWKNILVCDGCINNIATKLTKGRNPWILQTTVGKFVHFANCCWLRMKYLSIAKQSPKPQFDLILLRKFQQCDENYILGYTNASGTAGLHHPGHQGMLWVMSLPTWTACPGLAPGKISLCRLLLSRWRCLHRKGSGWTRKSILNFHWALPFFYGLNICNSGMFLVKEVWYLFIFFPYHEIFLMAKLKLLYFS